MLSAEMTIKLIETDVYYTSTLTKLNAALLLGVDPMYVESLRPFIDAQKQVSIEVKLKAYLLDEWDKLAIYNRLSLNDFVSPKSKKLFNSRKATKARYKYELELDAKSHLCYTKFLEYVASKGIDLDNLNFESHATLRMVILNKLAA